MKKGHLWIAVLISMTLAAMAFWAIPAAAQEVTAGVWTPMCSGDCPHPAGRGYAAMAFDPASQTTVMFGGFSGPLGFSRETWVWFGSRWAKIAPPVSPAGGYPVMAGDLSAGNVVLLEHTGRTWLWDGLPKRWEAQNPTVTPARRGVTTRKMAYDRATGNVILADTDQGGWFETWTWDGTTKTWTKLAPITSPPPRSYPSLSHMPGSGEVVLFGGYISNGTVVNDTWVWDGANNTWVKREPLVSPGARLGHMSTNHDDLGGILMFGGWIPADAWLYDGTTWLPQAVGPRSRDHHVMSYDPVHRQAVMFGGFDMPGGICNFCGLDETWTFGAQPAAPPTPIPDAPSNLTAAPGDGLVRLNWTAPSNNGSAITNYQIYRGNTSGAETLLATIGNQTTYDDVAATAGSTYYYKVAAMNSGGEGPQSNEASATVIVDTTPPQTTITGAPTSLSNSTSASFSFVSSEPASTFQCRLDSSAFSACTSPKSYNTLSQGAHTFAVAATDASGNADQTPASYSWTVDTSAPETTITSGPASLTNQSTASFSFSSNESGSSFDCRLDGATFSSCSSPKSYSGLTDGGHTFEVRAKDPANNVDLTPASQSWSIDTSAPAAPSLISPANESSTSNAKPTFDWSDIPDPSGVVYHIQIDNSGSSFPSPEVSQSGLTASSFTPPTSLAIGTYSWRVRATDGAGNGTWSSVFTVTITTPPGSIAGKVTDGATKKAISGATVNCGTAGTATSATDGSYSITGIAPGSYTCTASATGHKSASKTITVKSGSTTTLNFALRKG
jgi:hypothetical protein